MASPLIDPGVNPLVAEELQRVLDSINVQSPVDNDAPVVLALPRHGCPKARQARSAGRAVSSAIRLKEVYLAHQDGVHALIYREGQCPKCHQTARSKRGRVVLVVDRPPLEGRVARN